LAADVCTVLALINTTKALYALGADEKRAISLTLGKGNPNRSVISESGLYKLVMRSDKPHARQFQDWVTRDVLPAIRKDGAYVMGEEKVVTGELDEDAFVLKAIGILQAKMERLKAEKEALVAKAQVVQHGML
jgi:prophage antirepressor-like protein